VTRKKHLKADKIDELLCRANIISKEKIEEARKIQKEKGGHLSRILLDKGLIDEKTLLSILSQEFDIPPVDLSRFTVEPALIKLVPEHAARRFSLIPFARLGKTLTIAISDPSNIMALDDIKARTGLKIEVVLAGPKSIAEAIDRSYGSEKAMEDLFNETEEKVETTSLKEQAMSASELIEAVQDAPTVKLVDYLLTEAVKAKASDILIEPFQKLIRIRYRQDGILREKETLPRGMNQAIASRIKVVSQLDVAERRLPQDGRFKARISGRQVDFRVSVVPSNFGEKVAIRILDKKQLKLNLDDLGFEKENLQIIKDCSSRPYGFMLICGPTGCGKTTTLYSILNFLTSPGKNLVTVEDPVEYELENVNQVTARPAIGLSFANALRSILRQDPNIIMVGEIRDFETVDVAIKSALTGHLVISTLHTTDAVGSITRLLDMDVEPFLITSSLIMVGAQRLLRKICPNCREGYELSGEQLKKSGLDPNYFAGSKLYRGKGCGSCQKTGYSGRTGLIEVLALDEEINQLIFKKASAAEIKSLARKKGMTTLMQNGLKKVKAGITSLEEVMRVVARDHD
jgi:type IV pilus assembly protein PilB